MKFPRSSGILLHPTSLPGRFGIGDLGPQAHDFVDFLAETGQRWWQVLPLGPTGGMNSPYQSHSSFAGNPLLISPEAMVERGWLRSSDLDESPNLPADHVEFIEVARSKEKLLRRAFQRFPIDDPGFQEFLAASSGWLDDYALFVALKEATGDKPWYQWEPHVVARKASALARWRDKLGANIRYHQFVQYVFEIQMQTLRTRCAEKAVNLIGDIPIFVAHDSADVWARPDLFFLDASGRPTVQAGVPPDHFSATGQLWGNPLYRWETHEKEGFTWWIDRLNALLKWVDLIRLDHFRGFEAYWEVPGKAKTAAKGRWVRAPGIAFFKALRQRFVDLPLIAEDLGLITPEVEALRDEFGLPGMRVLQFGFSTSADDEKHLPHRFVPHCVVYTGTHDNDTSRGWLTSKHVQTTQSTEQIEAERSYALRYLESTVKEFHWDMIRLASSSIAEIAILPMQDVLGLDSSARMNVPGKAEGNWDWRFQALQLTATVKERLAGLTAVYGRWNGTIPARLDPHHVPRDLQTTKAPKELREGRTPLEEGLKPRETGKKPSRRDGSAHKANSKHRKKGPKQASLARYRMKPRYMAPWMYERR
jgi:4-alpha-glucanotransferase